MKPKTLKDLESGRQRRKHGCIVCGAPTAAVVQVAIRALADGRVDRMINSRQRSFCEPHAVETFQLAMSQIPAESL